MGVPVRERPNEAARAGRVDPGLLRALGWSLAAHVLVVATALLLAFFAPAPTMLDLPAGGPMVDLIMPRGDSKVFKVGPLAKASGQKAVQPKEAPKPEPPKAEIPKAEPVTAEPPKASPAPPVEPPKVEPPKVEPKPDALPEPKPEPKKPEPKPEPKKPEPKKSEPKPEPRKPEPKKPEPKKPEPKPEPKKPEAKKPEPKKSEPKAESPKAEAPRPVPAKEAPPEAKPTPGQENAGSSKPGPASAGGGHAEDGGQSGDPSGGGGGEGNRSPEFYAYFAYMYESIKAQWAWNGDQDASLAATVRFSILADGSIADARVTERSRSPVYDESALNAVRATAGLTPPPASVRAEFEDVELVFRPGELMQP